MSLQAIPMGEDLGDGRWGRYMMPPSIRSRDDEWMVFTPRFFLMRSLGGIKARQAKQAKAKVRNHNFSIAGRGNKFIRSPLLFGS